MKTTKYLFLASLALALPGHSANAAGPFRLDRIGIVQFSALANGRLLEAQDVLHVEGNIVWRSQSEIDRPADLPAWALDRPLVQRETWTAYYVLAPGALANFTLDASVTPLLVGEGLVRPVAVAENAQFARGRMINLSTRAQLNTGDAPVIAGFVIEGHARTLLVRAIGPGLADLGVTEPASDPLLRVYHGNEVVSFNDNWGTHWDAVAMRDASVRVGAFALDESSRDAVTLLTLEPGACTVHVELATASATGGTILVEVYEMPLD